MKIALCMIVKDSPGEVEHLKRCIDSAGIYVDKVYLYLNGKAGEPSRTMTRAISELQGAGHIVWTYGKWTNFGDARNKSFAMVPEDYDFILWMDTDDTLYNAEKLRQVALATPNHIDGVYMAYDYQHDEFGNVIVQHYVARMVRNNGSFQWSDKILHESLEPVRHCGKALNEEIKVIHHADDERRDESQARNIAMLEKELQGEGSNPDARTLYYLGAAYIDAQRLEEAKELLEMYLRLSGWAEERAQAWVHLGNIAEYMNDESEMRRCYIHAVTENPKDPSPFVELAKVETRNQLWGKAIEWLKMAEVKKVDPMTTVHQSTETTYKIYMYFAECYLNEGGRSLDDAYKYAKLAMELRPNEFTRGYFASIEKLISHRTMTEGVMETLRHMEETNKKLIPQFIQSLPPSLQDNPGILRYKKRHTPPKKWKKKSIVIFTGNSIIGEWGPWSLEEGVGGSEEAVIRLSRQLALQGWEVTVFATPGARVGADSWFNTTEKWPLYNGGKHKTVKAPMWRNYWEVNLGDTFDVFVAWRSPWFFDIPINARKKYLWLHDVMEQTEFHADRLKNLDKVIVLSKYHRSLYSTIPDDKIMLSANGIDFEDFEKEDGKHERDPHRVIYMSSHVRGLQILYEVWPEVKKEVPDAKLDVYYGWGSYDDVNRNNPERMEWKHRLVKMGEELEDVTDHGKVGQHTIVEETLKSGVWAYPCPFPEISCITAMKAQAGGAVPVSSNFAALEETVQFGTKLTMKQMDEHTPVGQWNKEDLNAFKEALIKELKNPMSDADRQKMMDWSRKNQSWAAVATQWSGEMG